MSKETFGDWTDELPADCIGLVACVPGFYSAITFDRSALDGPDAAEVVRKWAMRIIDAALKAEKAGAK